MSSVQKLIILRGPMGSGKTSIALRYRSFEAKYAHLSVDTFKNLFDHFDKTARSAVYAVVISALNNLLEQGFSVVLEGVLQDVSVIDSAIDASERRGIPWRLFELDAPLDVLTKRDAQRPEIEQGLRQPLGREAIMHMQDKLLQRSHPHAMKVNVKNYTVDEIVQRIEDEFQKETYITS